MGWSVLGLDTSSFRKTSSFGEFCGSDLLHCDGNFVNTTGLRPPELKPKGLLGIAKTPQHTDRDDQMSLGEPDVELSEDEEGIGEGVSLVHDYNSGPYPELFQEELDVGEDALNAAQDGEDEPGECGLAEATGSTELTPFEVENVVLSPLQPFSDEPTNPLASHSLSDPGMISDDEEEESDHSLAYTIVGEDINMEDDNRPYEIETQSDANMNDLGVADDSAEHQDTAKPTVSNEAGASQGIATSGKGKYDIPSIPILYASDTSIHLMTLSPEFYENARCLDPLYVKRGILSAHGMNRINMIEYIRELGVVVIATQIGRVGILSMTTHPTSDRPGFRMDWILPSRNREHGEEPTQSALHGIAVSPIQGHALESDSSISSEGSSPESEEFDASSCIVDGVRRTFDSTFVLLSNSSCSSSDDKSRVVTQAHRRRRRLDSESSETGEAVSGRRYRLMIYYNDHTVLTYEIGGQGQ